MGRGISVSLAAAVLVAACGGSKGTSSSKNGFEATSSGTGLGGAASTSTSGPGASGTTSGGGAGGSIGVSVGVGVGGQSTTLEVTPAAMQAVSIPLGVSTPAITFTASVDQGPVNAVWSVDKGDIATIPATPSSSAVLTASGTTGGVVTVTASYGSQTVTRPVLIKLQGSQNGVNTSIPGEANQVPSGVSDLSAGGGVGGVGGEGLGPGVTDMPTLVALQNPQNSAAAGMLTMLYPYNATVWPRGLLAPLLQWSWAMGDADAIQISLSTTTGSFSWTGTFGRPAILATTMGKYIRSPIPQDVWAAATNTAGGKGDKLTMSLTVALSGQGYGPVSETWIVAPARLTGSVYYNSYGTQFVKNWGGVQDTAGNPVGAAILGVRSGDLAPHIVAGQDSPLNDAGIPTDDSGCRVCHTVASNGRWLLTQSFTGSPGEGLSYLYDLSSTNVPASGVGLAPVGEFAWAAMTDDGSYALTNTVDPSSTNPAIGATTSALWNFIPTQPPPMMSPTTMPVQATLTGLPAMLAAGYPSFSPDNSMIAYVDATSSTSNVDGPIIAANYDASTQTFSNVTTLVPTPTGQRVGYPVFLPDNSGVVYEREVRAGCSDTVMVTRNGARGQIEWTNTSGASTPTPLAALNGTGYLPAGPNDHGVGNGVDPGASCTGYTEAGWDDTTLNYEPTVLPVVAGGYAWVVFTSRRLYGNQLTQTPWVTVPNYDSLDLSIATSKKLWVAAIDLGDPAGTDPSHPAFYLPAQEILAGNSRGFFVLDPCAADGATCQSGDQCCNGYCEPNGDAGALICSNTPPTSMCSGLQEKCTTASDCCDTTNHCVNGFCAAATPQ